MELTNLLQITWVDDGHCYVCGPHNHEGLKLAFDITDQSIETSLVAEKRHQGYKNILHGGILAMVMDEVMVMLPYRLFGSVVVNAEFTIKLLRPITVGQRLRVRAAFARKAQAHQRLYRMTAEARLDDGTVVAVGSGKCVPVSKGL